MVVIDTNGRTHRIVGAVGIKDDPRKSVVLLINEDRKVLAVFQKGTITAAWRSNNAPIREVVTERNTYRDYMTDWIA